MIRFILNESTIATELPPGMVLLDFIRYHNRLMGTKIGCREGDCGACTVLVGELQNGTLKYQSMVSCLMPLANAQGKHIVTIEGINLTNVLNPVQQAIADEGATQCGFCTPGFVMSLAGFCLNHKEPTSENAIAAVDGNICRCTGYKSIERAATKVAALMQKRNDEEPASYAAKNGILPAYFGEIKLKLQSLGNGEFLTPGSRVTRSIVAGGTDLYVQKHKEIEGSRSSFVFDDTQLKQIFKENNEIILGPSVTVTDLMQSKIITDSFPAFYRYAKLISSTPIRNMATVAGNFINASPIGDLTIFFLALDAQLSLSQSNSNGGEFRKLPLRKLFKGYKQLNKKSKEYITAISFNIPGKNTYFNFEKVSKRTHLDIASVNSAISISMDRDRIADAGISAGGVAPIPLFLSKTSEFLIDKTLSPGLINKSVDVMQKEISPISDARGTKEYKALLLGQLMRAHFVTLFPELELSELIQ